MAVKTGQGTDRIFGIYDHHDPVAVALRDDIPTPQFSQQQAFLNEVVEQLRREGRDIHISRTGTGSSLGDYERVLTVREHESSIMGVLRNAVFRFMELWYGAPRDLRKLGNILYRLGDDFSEIEDLQVRKALEAADKIHPYTHQARMPIGTHLSLFNSEKSY